MYYKMSEILKPWETRNFVLDSFEITFKEQKSMYRPSDYIPLGVYSRLRRKFGNTYGDVVMSDTPMEKETNEEIIKRAKGDVLLCGLGIGMILLPIQNKPEVTSVTVLEKEIEIIWLIERQLPLNKKVRIIQGDCFKHKFINNEKFDTIYFDIWDFINSDITIEAKKLKARYRKYLKNKDSFMLHWTQGMRKSY